MELNYKINIKQKENLNLSNNLVSNSDNLSIKVYNFDNEFQIISNSDNISNHFEKTNHLVQNLKTKENFILGYENLSNNVKSSPHLIDNNLSNYNPNNLHQVKEFTFLPLISEEDTYELFILEEDIFTKVSKDLYKIDIETRSIVSELDEDNDYFLYLIKDNFKYKKVSNTLTLKPEDFLNISTGFYEIYPQIKHKVKDIMWREKNSDTIVFSSDEFTSITSDVYINFDNCITNNFNAIPFSFIELKYTSNDYTPLNEIDNFSVDNEYILFELENNECIPKYFISTDIETEGDSELITKFNLLMQSHSEFKKPFLVLSDKSNIVLEKSNNIFNKVIYNTDFSKIKSNDTLIDTLTKIKI